MPPSTTPPSPTVTCSMRTSPLILPSTWISPPPEMSPSITMSAPMIDGALGARGAAWRIDSDDGAGAALGAVEGAVVWGVEGVAEPVGVEPGWGVLELGLLNIVAGLYETEGVLGTA